MSRRPLPSAADRQRHRDEHNAYSVVVRPAIHTAHDDDRDFEGSVFDGVLVGLAVIAAVGAVFLAVLWHS